MEGAIFPTLLQTTQNHKDKHGCHGFDTEPDLEEIFRSENFL